MPHYFKMRARDTACEPAITYHTWVTVSAPDPTGSQAGALPCGAGPGDLTDIQVVQDWVVPDDTPLNHVLHVDGVKGDNATATGSASLPFATIQAAVDVTDASGPWQILIAPGPYIESPTLPDNRSITFTGAHGGSLVNPAVFVSGTFSLTSAIPTNFHVFRQLQIGGITVTGAAVAQIDLEHTGVTGTISGPVRLTLIGTRKALGSTTQVGTVNVTSDCYASGSLITTLAATSNAQLDYTFVSSCTMSLGTEGMTLRNESRISSPFSGTFQSLNINSNSDMTVASGGTVNSNVNVLNSTLSFNGTCTGTFVALSSTLTMNLATASFGDDVQVTECALGWSGTTLAVGGNVCRISNCTHESATGSPLVVNFTGPAGFLYADSESITRTVDGSNVVQNGVSVTNGSFVQLTRPSARTRVLYVDGGVGDNIIGNGTESNPFATVQAAIDVTSNDGTYHIYISPGNYTGDGTIAIPDNREIVLEGADSVCGGPPVAPAVELGNITVDLASAAIQELHLRHMEVGNVTFTDTANTGLVTFEHCVAGTVSGQTRVMAWGALNSLESTTTIAFINISGAFSNVTATSTRLVVLASPSVTLHECRSGTIEDVTGALTMVNCTQMTIGGDISIINSTNSDWNAVAVPVSLGNTTIQGSGGFIGLGSNTTFTGSLTVDNASLFIGTAPTFGGSLEIRNSVMRYDPTTLTVGGTLCRLTHCTHLSGSGGDLSVVFSGAAGNLIADATSLNRTDSFNPTVYAVSVSNGTLTRLGGDLGLTRTLHVDGGLGNDATADGTASRPFATVNAAIGATSNDGTYHIRISPGDYSGDATIAIPDNREIVLEGADSICGGPPVAPAVELGNITIALTTATIQELHLRHMQVGNVTFTDTGTIGLVTFEHCVAGTVTGNARVMAWGALNSTESTTTIASISVASSVIATSSRLDSVVCSSIVLYECNSCTLGAITGVTIYNSSQISIEGNVGSMQTFHSDWSATNSAVNIGTLTVQGGGQIGWGSTTTFTSTVTVENASLFIGTAPTFNNDIELRNCIFHYNPTTLTLAGTLFRLAQCTHLSNSGGDLTITFSGSAGTVIADRVSLARTDTAASTRYLVSASNGVISTLDPEIWVEAQLTTGGTAAANATVIQDLIDAGIKHIQLPAGSFTIDSINMATGVHMRGEGITETILTWGDQTITTDDGSQGPINVHGTVGTHITDVVLEDFTIDGNKSGVTVSGAGVDLDIECISHIFADYCESIRVFARNANSDGWDYDDSTYCKTIDCVAEDCDGYGFHSSERSTYLTHIRGVALTCGVVHSRGGFDTHGTNPNEATHCTFESCRAIGCHRGFVINGHFNALFGCYAIDCINTGIRVGGSDNILSACHSTGTTTGNGLTLDGAFTADRNSLMGVNSSSNAGGGIVATSGATLNSLVGSQTHSNTGNGVQFSAGANNNTVIAFSSTGNSGSDVDDSGTGNQVGDAVDSVFGRTGTVVAAASDYDASQVDNDSGVSGATVAAALNQLDSDITAISPSSAESLADDPASGNVTLTVLTSGHTAGVYHVSAYAEVETAVTTGDVTARVNYTNGSARSIDFTPTAQDVSTTGELGFASILIRSDGSANIEVEFVYASVTGNGAVDHYGRVSP